MFANYGERQRHSGSLWILMALVCKYYFGNRKSPSTAWIDGAVWFYSGPSLESQQKNANKRGQHWFEQTDLPLQESFGFRKGLGTDDALFVLRRFDEEVSAWQRFGWHDAVYEAGLMHFKKAYPTANKQPFWAIVTSPWYQCRWPLL